ncbi:MAG TPA: 16S rRNA (cytosine(967)-C(5))-methyltransferase RsmB [Gemmatimonadaceae bacterium]|jgi:16S rRNA (cytosine967-C5)-methyltransferase|nr:16S rRNA (cytosine(967)-C(5))-methyltransferase RsmB [Gemmatimonadaceae bacterium]
MHGADQSHLSSSGGSAGGDDASGGGVRHRTSAVTDARVAAADILADVRSGDLLDPAFDRRTMHLDPRDRRWVRELVYGSFRRRSRLDAYLDERIRGGAVRLDADLLDLLRLGAAQLLYMGSVPAYAAIAQTVELAKRRHGIGASKLTNAVLRRLDRERESLRLPPSLDPIERLAIETSHPRWLVTRWVERWGFGATQRLLEANNREAPLVVRAYHAVREQLEAMLEAAGVHVEEAPLVRDSIVLSSPVSSFTELGPFRQGLFHLQDPASTLVTQYACVATGALAADVCAAPGGKSIELSRSAAHVFSSDLSWTRLMRVLENKRRLEIETLHAYVADARFPAIRPVDAVLLDAPCTGTGTFRRHPDARWRLRISDLAVMAALQRSVLNGAAQVVKPGGLLIYSTCSLEPEENDMQVDRFLAEHRGWTLEPPPEGVVPPAVLDRGLLRVLPHEHGTDGAFAARLRRSAS